MNTIWKFVVIAFCLCCPAQPANAQCRDTAKLNITATLYTQENGLPCNIFVTIAKDNAGYRYFLGMDGKWSRYDGLNFVTSDDYSHIPFNEYAFMEAAPENYVRQLIDKTIYKYEKFNKGNCRRWALTGDSLILTDISGTKKQAYRIPEGAGLYPGADFFPDGDICWLTTREKVFRFDAHSNQFIRVKLPASEEITPPGIKPFFIISRPGGCAYLIAKNVVLKADSGLTSFNIFCRYASAGDAGRRPSIVMDTLLFLEEQSTLLDEINLNNGSVHKFNLATNTNVKNPSALKIVALRNYNNYLIIATSNCGLFIFNPCTGSMQNFEYKNQNAGEDLLNSVEWIAVDDENVLWMQTGAGLIKIEINNQKIKAYKPSSVIPLLTCYDCNNVRAIYGDGDNTLLLGTIGGLYTFNTATEKFGNVISPLDKKRVWNDQAVSAITGDRQGNIYIASWGNEGILLLNRGKKKLVNMLPPKLHPQLSFSNLRCLLYDSHNALWAGRDVGFIRISNPGDFEKNDFKGPLNVTNHIGKKTGEHAAQCFVIAEDSLQNIWLGTTNGLYVYSYKNDSVSKYTHLDGSNSSLSNNDVRSIYVSENNDIWVGTNGGGLNHFNAATNTFNSIGTQQGLPNNTIYTILGDDKGFLWLGTNAGLCRFNKTDHTIRNYTPRDGIQNFEFNTNAAGITADGKFCFGGRSGFNIFQPDSMNAASAPPQVAITRFKIFDKEYPVPDSVLHLSHNQNSLTFEFASLSYYRSNDNQYAYMLEGADKDWIKSGNRPYISYSNLKPGKYTFKVRAANYTGLWTSNITTIRFIIRPAWYNTWWFWCLAVVLIAAGIYGLYRYRLRQLMKVQVLRNRIAGDLHDEIGSTLSSISLSSTIIRNKLNGNNAEVTRLLEQVSRNTDNMMEALSDIVWVVNTRNDRFDNVVKRMHVFAVEILEPGDINISFNTSEGIGNIYLDMQQRKNLYLIFKEAVNNIAKYAACKNVYIDIIRSGSKTFILNIKDDGKGFKVTVAGGGEKSLSGNGIKNMKKRTEELGGELTIDSVEGAGTTLKLKFNI